MAPDHPLTTFSNECFRVAGLTDVQCKTQTLAVVLPSIDSYNNMTTWRRHCGYDLLLLVVFVLATTQLAVVLNVYIALVDTG